MKLPEEKGEDGAEEKARREMRDVCVCMGGEDAGGREEQSGERLTDQEQILLPSAGLDSTTLSQRREKRTTRTAVRKAKGHTRVTRRSSNAHQQEEEEDRNK